MIWAFLFTIEHILFALYLELLWLQHYNRQLVPPLSPHIILFTIFLYFTVSLIFFQIHLIISLFEPLNCHAKSKCLVTAFVCVLSYRGDAKKKKVTSALLLMGMYPHIDYGASICSLFLSPNVQMGCISPEQHICSIWVTRAVSPNTWFCNYQKFLFIYLCWILSPGI